MNKFLRTASTRRLLAALAGLVLAIAAGTTIAIAAKGGGPTPRKEGLAKALHGALTAKQVPGISAAITFTNKLINASQIQGPTDPLLSGGPGRIWVSGDGQLRIELNGNNGDPAVVLNKSSWWVSDPLTQTVYEGTMPKDTPSADKKSAGKRKTGSIPTISQIQKELNQLAAHLNISKALPTDIAGQPAYTVRVSPKHDGGLLGQAELAWDAVRGVPLTFNIYANGGGSPVLGITATNVTYSHVDPHIFSMIKPPSGYHVVKVASPAGSGASGSGSKSKGKGKHESITGVAAVQKRVPFQLVAPDTLVGLGRQSATLLDWSGHPAALITYGQNLGGIAVIEQAADTSSSASQKPSAGLPGNIGLAFPSVKIGSVTGQEIDTALGTVVQFTRAGVDYTVVGSVTPTAADAAARAL